MSLSHHDHRGHTYSPHRETRGRAECTVPGTIVGCTVTPSYRREGRREAIIGWPKGCGAGSVQRGCGGSRWGGVILPVPTPPIVIRGHAHLFASHRAPFGTRSPPSPLGRAGAGAVVASCREGCSRGGKRAPQRGLGGDLGAVKGLVNDSPDPCFLLGSPLPPVCQTQPAVSAGVQRIAISSSRAKGFQQG